MTRSTASWAYSEGPATPVFDLAIVGCGPVGAVAANLAGAAGLSVLVVDREEHVLELPRAVHFDAHVMRILQQAGVAGDILPDTRVWKRSTFRGADGKPIRVHDWAQTTELGWHAHYLFFQPALEATLRDRLSRRDTVQIRLGMELVGLVEETDNVMLSLRPVGGSEPQEARARYVIGADGASSFVRGDRGIDLVDHHFDEPWMVIDLVSDREFGPPGESEMFCDPARPATRIPGPGRHHRWEFILLPGESAESIQRPESIANLLDPWVAINDVEILRASVYRFHALVAERWRDGPVFLIGDAAHQTPVFLGQGLCHGIRDAQNLVWKLAAALRGGAENELLDSFESERRPHVETIIAMAVNAGRDICLLDPVAAAQRDARMRHEAASGELPRTTFQGMPPLHGGLFRHRGAGELFPQPELQSGDGRAGLMDDLLGGVPAVVVMAPVLDGFAASIEALGARLVTVEGDTRGAPAALSAPASTRAWLHERGARAAVLRPDGYVYALSAELDGVTAPLGELCGLIAGAQPQPDGGVTVA